MSLVDDEEGQQLHQHKHHPAVHVARPREGRSAATSTESGVLHGSVTSDLTDCVPSRAGPPPGAEQPADEAFALVARPPLMHRRSDHILSYGKQLVAGGEAPPPLGGPQSRREDR